MKVSDELKKNRPENDRADKASSRHARDVAPIQIRDRIKELRRVQARDLEPNVRNWRRHPQSQIAALSGLLTQIGYADALIARELPSGKLQLIDGHARRQVTPDSLVPVLIVDLDEEEANLVLLTLDPIAGLAEASADNLKALIEIAHSDSEAVQALIEHIAGPRLWQALHPSQIDEAEISPERADELRLKWGTEEGQEWNIEAHRLTCADSRDELAVGRLWTRGGPLFRMGFADPPYGVSYGEKTEWTNTRRRGIGRRPIENDSLQPIELQKLFAISLNVARRHAMPGAALYATVPSAYLKYFIQGFEDGGFAYRHCLIWVKQTFVLGRSDYHYRHEPILYGWLENGAHFFIDDRTQDSVFEINRPIASEMHPTTKPIELIARMIANSSRPGDLIYDPFCGSGSSIVAAHQLGRIGYGCEVDPAYVAVALERLSMLGLKPTLIATNR
jgi:DNA modification methylase